MASIQATTGLISGLNYTDIVDKLMTIAAEPQTALQNRNKTLNTQMAAVTNLSALLLSLEYGVDQLKSTSLYSQKTSSSSDSSVVASTVSGSPANGTYRVQAARTVSTQQYLSDGFSSQTAALGAGTVSLRYGRDLAESQGLSVLNGGSGITRGTIRVTDRSGTTANIDLSAVQSVDDVLDAINNQTAVQVRAETDGDRIRLVDTSGRTASNLKVQEVSNGHTAASLGLAGIDVAANAATGSDVVYLSRTLSLDSLNDGAGMRFDTALGDIQYTLRDGTTGTIDLSPIISGSSQVDQEKTLGDVSDRINAAAPGKLQAGISADGDRLVVTDLTTGTGDFSLQSLYDSQAVEDLGLTGTAAGGVIQGRRLLGGAKTALLSSLNGGQGLGTLGAVQLTDRSGHTATVDLSQAQTVDDVTDALNAAGLGITAALNAAGNGILLTDTTGSSAGNLVVADADATQTADKLHIAVNAAASTVNSGDLHLRVVGWNTTLDSLNGGAGVNRGSFTITDSSGARASVNLSNTSTVQTVGDVVRAINRLNLQVTADLNDTGDGIVLRDAGGGSGTLTVTDDSGGTAADLHLAQAATSATQGGQTIQQIDGRQSWTVSLSASDTLATLRDKLNALGAGAQASVISDGSSKPYRLSLSSGQAGQAGRMVVDTSGLAGLSLDRVTEGQDALLVVLNSSTAATGLLVSSTSNKFVDAVSGLTLNVKQASSTPVTISVGATNSNLSTTLQTIVDDYNKYRSKLSDLTSYNSDTNTAAALNSDPAAIRLDTDLSRLLSDRFTVSGSSIHSLAELGISIKDDGTLELDSDKFQTRYDSDPDGVQKLLSDQTNGVAAKFHATLESLASEDSSLLTNRLKAMQQTIDDNQTKIDRLTATLDQQRDRMLIQFYNLEQAIAKMQSSVSFLNSISYLGSTTSSSNSSSSSSGSTG